MEHIEPRPRDECLEGITHKSIIGCGNLYITANSDNIGLAEIFVRPGKSGGCPSQSEAIGRLISLALRCGISKDAIHKQLSGIRCPSCLRKGDKVGALSCPDAISRIIRKISDEQLEGGLGESSRQPDKQSKKPRTKPAV